MDDAAVLVVEFHYPSFTLGGEQSNLTAITLLDPPVRGEKRREAVLSDEVVRRELVRCRLD